MILTLGNYLNRGQETARKPRPPQAYDLHNQRRDGRPHPGPRLAPSRESVQECRNGEKYCRVEAQRNTEKANEGRIYPGPFRHLGVPPRARPTATSAAASNASSPDGSTASSKPRPCRSRQQRGSSRRLDKHRSVQRAATAVPPQEQRPVGLPSRLPRPRRREAQQPAPQTPQLAHPSRGPRPGTLTATKSTCCIHRLNPPGPSQTHSYADVTGLRARGETGDAQQGLKV